MTVEITGQSGTVSVGEKMSQKVTFSKEWGVLKSVEWTIPGQIVKGYTDSQTKAKVTKIEESDKKKNPIHFHWVDGGNGRKVEAKCVFTSKGTDKNKTVSATFDVKAPTLDKFNATTDLVGLDPTSSPTKLRFGINKEGIKWDWKITVPSISDGYVKDVQTVRVVRKRTTTAAKKQVWTISGTKVPPPEQLDTDNPYSLPGEYPPCPGFPKKVTAGNSFSDNSTFDSPGTPLAGTKMKSFDDKFKYYIMYKPDKTDAIWVPVGKSEWYCKGKATLNDSTGKWSLSSQGGGISSAGVKTTGFPQYTSNAKYNVWQDE